LNYIVSNLLTGFIKWLEQSHFNQVNKHVIVFRKFKHGIWIIRVLYQSMDIIQQLQ